jgi:MoxR-like ATPase
VLDGRDYVIPDDVQAEARLVFVHRIRTASGSGTAAELVDAALSSVGVP